MKAQEFVGKCLDIASNRPSATELLMDPFLAPEEEKEPESPDNVDSRLLASAILRIPIPSDDDHKSISRPLMKAPKKNTKMMITGTMNAEDDTIFLKVQISDKNGTYLNFYHLLQPYRDHNYNVVKWLTYGCVLNHLCLAANNYLPIWWGLLWYRSS